MAAWSRKILGKNHFFVFFWKDDLLRENFKIPFRKDSSRPIDVLCSNLVKLGRRKIGKVVGIYLTKKFRLALQLLLLRGSRSKSARASPPDNVLIVVQNGFHPNRLTFGGVIFECLNTVRARSKVNSTFGRSLASSRIIQAFFDVRPLINAAALNVHATYAHRHITYSTTDNYVQLG